MSGCDACVRAAESPLTGRFNSACFECSARSLAGSPLYHDAARADALTPSYRDALQTMFKEHWKHGHERVRFYADRIAKVKSENEQ